MSETMATQATTWVKVHNPENGCGLDWELWEDGGIEDFWIGSFVTERAIDLVIADHNDALRYRTALERIEDLAQDCPLSIPKRAITKRIAIDSPSD